MTTWRLAAVGGMLLLLSGCKIDPEIERLEHENLCYKRQIEHLHWKMEEMQGANGGNCGPCEGPGWRPADAAPRTISQPGPMLGSADGMPATVVPPAHAMPGTFAPNGRVPSTVVPEEGAAITPPIVVMPRQSLPPGQVPETLAPPAERPAPESASPPPLRGSALRPPDNSRVAQISLNPSAGDGEDRRRGEAISLLVEPRDIAGNLLMLPGDLSVALLDPGAAAGTAPLARWDFRAAETAGMLERGPGGGIRLDLPWPVLPTTPDHLRLLVRYTTRDGRRLQAEKPIELAAKANDSWHPGGREGPGAGEAESPRTASRASDVPLRRPVWSPNRY
jgi:hypothetical protein